MTLFLSCIQSAVTVLIASPLSLIGNATKFEYFRMISLIVLSLAYSKQVSFSDIVMILPWPDLTVCELIEAADKELEVTVSIVNVPVPSDVHLCIASTFSDADEGEGIDSTVTLSETMKEL